MRNVWEKAELAQAVELAYEELAEMVELAEEAAMSELEAFGCIEFEL